MSRIRIIFPFFGLLLLLSQGCFSDSCRHIDCVQGACVEGDCVCETGFTGIDCDKRMNLAFAGDYRIIDETCSGSGAIPTPYDVIIFASASTPTLFTVAGLNGEPQNLALVNAEVDRFGWQFTVARQAFSNNGLEIEGEGSLAAENADIVMNYRLYQNQNLSDSCTVTFQRQ